MRCGAGAVFQRCFVNATAAVDLLQKFGKLVGVNETQVLDHVSSLVQYKEVDRTHLSTISVILKVLASVNTKLS